MVQACGHLDHHPDKALLYALINHFNPSAYALGAADWGAALGALMQPGRLIPMSALAAVRCPTFPLVGSEDPIVPLSAMREWPSA